MAVGINVTYCIVWKYFTSLFGSTDSISVLMPTTRLLSHRTKNEAKENTSVSFDTSFPVTLHTVFYKLVPACESIGKHSPIACRCFSSALASEAVVASETKGPSMIREERRGRWCTLSRI